MKLFDKSIKRFLKKNMYFNKSVIKKTNEGKKVVKKLFYIMTKNPKKYIKLYRLNKKTFR